MGLLAVVEKLQPVSQRRISDHLGLNASDVVGVLDGLDAASMVERRAIRTTVAGTPSSSPSAASGPSRFRAGTAVGSRRE